MTTPFPPKWPCFTRAGLHWEKVVLVAYQRRWCARGKWFAHQSYYIKKKTISDARQRYLCTSLRHRFFFFWRKPILIHDIEDKQTFKGEGDLDRAWLLKSVYSKTPNTNTDTEGAVESVLIDGVSVLSGSCYWSQKTPKTRGGFISYSRIAVAFAHRNFSLFLGLKTMKNSSGQIRRLCAYVVNEFTLKL